MRSNLIFRLECFDTVSEFKEKWPTHCKPGSFISQLSSPFCIFQVASIRESQRRLGAGSPVKRRYVGVRYLTCSRHFLRMGSSNCPDMLVDGIGTSTSSLWLPGSDRGSDEEMSVATGITPEVVLRKYLIILSALKAWSEAGGFVGPVNNLGENLPIETDILDSDRSITRFDNTGLFIV